MNWKGRHFEKEIILWGIRWSVAYPISYRQLEEMMGERGGAVDHSTLNRWVMKYAPEVEKQCRHHQRCGGRSGRMDETYVKIKGKWAYLYRAVDKEAHTIDFLLTPTRDRDAAEAFLRKAIRSHGLPEKITIDKSGSNSAAIKHYNKVHKTASAGGEMVGAGDGLSSLCQRAALDPLGAADAAPVSLQLSNGQCAPTGGTGRRLERADPAGCTATRERCPGAADAKEPGSASGRADHAVIAALLGTGLRVSDKRDSL